MGLMNDTVGSISSHHSELWLCVKTAAVVFMRGPCSCNTVSKLHFHSLQTLKSVYSVAQMFPTKNVSCHTVGHSQVAAINKH